MPAEMLSQPETYTLAEIIGGAVTAFLGGSTVCGGGVHLVRRIRNGRESAEEEAPATPSPACPINGRLTAIDRLAERMEEYVGEQRALNQDLRGFIAHVQAEHGAQEDDHREQRQAMVEVQRGLAQANTALGFALSQVQQRMPGG